MTYNIFYTKTGDKSLVESDIFQQVSETLEPEKKPEGFMSLEELILSDRAETITLLKQEDIIAGFSVFDMNRIYYIHLDNDIYEKKIASYVLSDKTVTHMRNMGAAYITAGFPRFKSNVKEQAYLTEFSLMDFVNHILILSRLDPFKCISPPNLSETKQKKFGFYSYSPEHKEKIIELNTRCPDGFISMLLKNLKGDDAYPLIHSCLFSDMLNTSHDYSPSYSTVVYDENKNCAAYLLCNEEGVIRDIRVNPRTSAGTTAMYNLLFRRLLENWEKKQGEYISIYHIHGEKPLENWVISMGFQCLEEYSIWGWSRG